MLKKLCTPLMVLGLMTSLRAAPTVGQQAPDFKLNDEMGNPRTLKEFLGKKVVLYFFPKAYTPDCTKQACKFNTDLDLLSKHNVVVLGVSYDSVSTLKTFKEQNHFKENFTFLSDSTKDVASSYGAYRWWFPWIPKRMTFIIDEKGTITSIMEDVDAAANAQQVLTALDIQQLPE